MKALIVDTTITLFAQIPQDWVRPDGTSVLNYANATSYHYPDGWRDYVEPSFDPATERAGDLIEIGTDPNKTVTRQVIPLTQEEQDNYAESQEESVAEQEVNGIRVDGETEARRVYRHLKKLHNKGTLNDAQYLSARDIMFDALLPLEYGQWEVSEARLLAIPDPGNQTLLDILNEIRTSISDYVANNL